MSIIFTSGKTNYLQIAACILLMFNTACNQQKNDSDYHIRFSADFAENNHLKQIFLSCNGDSIRKCVWADYLKQRYYIFWTGVPSETRFNDYLVEYARKKYGLILIECGARNHPGAYYYNKQMAVYFSKARKKPLYTVYLEAKDHYNKDIMAL